MYDVILEALKNQAKKKAEKKGAERGGKKEEEWRFHILQPPPAKWKPKAVPLAKLPEVLGISYKSPELWELCRDVEEPLRCYRVLTKGLRDREVFGFFLRGLMSSADLRKLVELVEKGDKKALERYVYSRFRP